LHRSTHACSTATKPYLLSKCLRDLYELFFHSSSLQKNDPLLTQ
jgi:hypothetical protein